MWNNYKLISRIAYLVSLLAIIISLFGGFYYFIKQNFVLNKIQLIGDFSHVSSADLQYIKQYCSNATLFDLNIEELSTQMQNIPWVESVMIIKQFPDTLNISISNKKPVAKINDQAFITKDGVVFKGHDESLALPHFMLDDMNLTTQALALYKDLFKFTKRYKFLIKDIYITPDGFANINFNPDLSIWLCPPYYESNIELLNKIYTKLVKVYPNINYINMCYKHAVAVKQRSFVIMKPNEEHK